MIKELSKVQVFYIYRDVVIQHRQTKEQNYRATEVDTS